MRDVSSLEERLNKELIEFNLIKSLKKFLLEGEKEENLSGFMEMEET